jgi:hypothetical protein
MGNLLIYFLLFGHLTVHLLHPLSLSCKSAPIFFSTSFETKAQITSKIQNNNNKQNNIVVAT